MRIQTLIGSVAADWEPRPHASAAMSTAVALLVDPGPAGDLRVMSTGLGSGTVISTPRH